MFKPTRINYSALSKRTKRVQVQLLRDFPRFNLFKGQVIHVKPSLMMNYLHPYNGAKYIMKPSDIRPGLLRQYEIRKSEMKKQAELDSIKASSNIDTSYNTKSNIADKEGELTQRNKVSFLGTDITTKDIKIPGLNI